MQQHDGRSRVIIEGITPQVDCGEFPIKRVVGEYVDVEADIFTDGHDLISAVLCYRQGDGPWHEVTMEPLVNDRWRARFQVEQLGPASYQVQAWVDHFKTWVRDTVKRINADNLTQVDLQIGAQLIEEVAEQTKGDDQQALRKFAQIIAAGGAAGAKAAVDPQLAALMARHAPRPFVSTSGVYHVNVERERARFSAWYEFFPRSFGSEPGKHGTLREAESMLPYVAKLGFDVIYLPPIYPIGLTKRKGKNNTLVAGPDDPGSPWAIGGEAGGHTAVNPQLGTLEDFDHFVAAARQHDMEIALDIAFQVAPDHPYVKEHPEWFRWRPDNTVQYAENPPKKYEDIYPFNFETEDWQAMWEELKNIFVFWIKHGVTIFRVDNPHTKSFPFWQWAIAELKRDYPETIFLSEAFTRPRVMQRLAKLGFSQSYTYFTWRNTKWELTEYMTELTRTNLREYLRPNFWPNTPDILPEALQIGGRPAFMSRVILAATLAASYGLYGPAYELGENTPTMRGKEEYLNSEKYEIKRWQIDRPDSLAPLLARLNQIRRENPALQTNDTLVFHEIGNDQLLAYSKTTPDGQNVILVIVNLDHHYTQAGFTNLNLAALGIENNQAFQIHDLLSGERYLWSGPHNYVELNPHKMPAHIFRIRRHLRNEQDFAADYFGG